ncbi:MAG: NAD(P)H-binding protein [Burkholderiales bacterium]|nr:NAD(P)H-binding protein [Burkholderiales bacterium]MDE2287979.1 NAD(P)H-binding protein [Burkholderiales bacterium]MDE2611602.1 NAD(P)H-binding protein [Burkholderiales bacterium]
MFVIFGAAGNVGRASAAALRQAGHPVRAVVRQARQAEPLTRLGCEIAVADLTDPVTVARALDGAQAVQMLCPVPRSASQPAQAMRHMIDVAAGALLMNPPPRVVALSDYGAELCGGTGITELFHDLESRFAPLGTRLCLLRSAEHMHNWARVMPVALATGVLPSLHDPLGKQFPCVAAQDVGRLAAALLCEAFPSTTGAGPRVLSVEGPERVSALDVARVLGEVAGREIVARAVPREQWAATLAQAGLSEQHARLIGDLFDAHNAGRIDVEPGVGQCRRGTTTLAQAFAAIVPRVMAAMSHR